MKLLDLKENYLYWHGSKWLVLSKSFWPTQQNSDKLISVEIDKRFINVWICAEEYALAENYILKIVQRRCFSEDYSLLQTTGKLHRNCSFKDMDPKFDLDCQLIVCGDRLTVLILPERQKRPASERQHGRKISFAVHCRNCHSPQDMTIAILRERFYIIHLREIVRRVFK